MGVKMNYRKGQAAIEFLVTYGWAILAAMLVITALTYFGIVRPGVVLPDTCTFSNAFQCNDFRITAGVTRVKLINTLGQTIYEGSSGSIVATLVDGGVCVFDANGAPNPTLLEPEGIIEVACNNAPLVFNVDDKEKVKITVTYAKNPSGYNQISLGEIYATVQ
jgi:hypothetical protein